MASNIQAVRRQIDILKTAVLSPDAFRKMHADIAKKAISDLEAEQGRYPRETVVDGRRGASEETVKAYGVIQYEISAINDVVDDVYDALAALSPIKNPNKKRGHPSRWYLEHIWVFVNGQKIDGDGAGLDIGLTDSVVFVDVAPYARKIEFGLSKKYAPNGVFEVTARKMARKWSNVCKITFDYRGVSNPPAYKNFTPRGALKYPSIEIGQW